YNKIDMDTHTYTHTHTIIHNTHTITANQQLTPTHQAMSIMSLPSTSLLLPPSGDSISPSRTHYESSKVDNHNNHHSSTYRHLTFAFHISPPLNLNRPSTTASLRYHLTLLSLCRPPPTSSRSNQPAAATNVVAGSNTDDVESAIAEESGSWQWIASV
ncbi:Unknown protein, partial [Striga hermonthica]